MKSIQNQYIDLKEGRMSQHNFMRNLRMSMPQYITNVTSFKDAVRILKNKAILNETNINELSPQTKYNAAMKAAEKSYFSDNPSDIDRKKAVRQGNKFISEIDPVLKKAVIDFGKSLGFETKIEKGGTRNMLEPIVQILMGKDLRNPEVRVVIRKGTDNIEGGQYLPDEAAERRLGNLIKQIQQKELNVELKESAPGRDVELYQKYLNDVTDAMGDGLTYADAITKVAAENEISEDDLSTMVPEQSVGDKAYADNYDELYEAKDPVEDTIKSYLIKGYSYAEAIKLTAAEQGMDEEVLMSQYPQDTVDIEGYEDEEDDEEFLNMIAKVKKEKEEEEGIKSGFGIQDPMEENQDYFPRDPEEMAQAIADEFRDELLSLSGIEREKMAISHAYEKILNSGHPKAKIIARNLAFGYADEDWPMDYISSLFQILRKENLNEAKKKKAPKKELHPNQIHPSELRMGIKVELEHTDELDKAKKIALDHLAENPYYYTALKLAGVESPSAPKVKPPVAFKKEVSAAVELVDKANAMKPVKGFEKAKASSNKAKKETNKVVKGVEELTHTAKSVRGLQKFAATGGKMKTVKTLKEAQISGALPNEEINNTTKQVLQYVDSDIANPILKALSKDIKLQSLRDNRTLLRYMYWEPLPDPAIRALELQFKVEGDTDIDDDTAPREFYILSPKSNAAKNLGSSLEMGANKASKMDAFKEALEKLVRETLAETFDGRDNLANITDDTK